MDPIALEAEKRATLGKKVKALRRDGITPANIFGHSIGSQAIQVKTEEVEKVLAKAGATHMIMIKGPSFKRSRRVLTKGVQRDAITGKLLHIDFHQISMKDKVRVEVPLVFQGESPASHRKDLILLENLRSVEVECLPSDIPANIEIDLTKLEEAGDHILISDLGLGDNVTILTRSDDVVARVEFAKVVEVEEEEVEELEGVEEEAEAVAEEAPKAEVSEPSADESAQ